MRVNSVILMCLGLAVLLSCNVVRAEKARFDNYRIYTVKIESTEQLMQLQEIDRHLDGVGIHSSD